MTSPASEATTAYKFPFTLRQDQQEDVNRLVAYERGALFNEPGLGKTATSTAICMYWGLRELIDQVLCLVPPVLIPQWAAWLRSFKGLDVTVYRGLPKQREAISLDSDFVITTLGLFKNDHDRFLSTFANRKTALLIDEAASIRMPGTGNYKAVQDFVGLPNKRLLMLTGTPLGSTPYTAYGYIKLKTPDVYRDLRQFTLIHVTSCDMRGNPNGFQNLDLLRRNFLLQASERKTEDILNLPEVTYTPVRYDLDPKHKRLYDQLVEDLLLELDNGVVIDATTVQKLYTTSQQLVLNVPDGKTRPAGYDVLDQVIEETGLLRKTGEKLMVFTHFRKSNDAITEYLRSKGIGCVQVYGGADNDKAVQAFEHEPGVKIMLANPRSGGVGLNLQFCHYQLFMELPRTSGDFQQAIARVKRDGQKHKCTVWIATAIGTIQETLQRSVLRKEDVLVKVSPTRNTLRAALTGRG